MMEITAMTKKKKNTIGHCSNLVLILKMYEFLDQKTHALPPEQQVALFSSTARNYLQKGLYSNALTYQRKALDALQQSDLSLQISQAVETQLYAFQLVIEAQAHAAVLEKWLSPLRQEGLQDIHFSDYVSWMKEVGRVLDQQWVL